MSDERRGDEWIDPRTRSKGDESERILEEAFLTGGRDATGAGKLSAAKLSTAARDNDPGYFKGDSSWGSHSEVEGEPGEGGPKGLWYRLRHLFSG